MAMKDLAVTLLLALVLTGVAVVALEATGGSPKATADPAAMSVPGVHAEDEAALPTVVGRHFVDELGPAPLAGLDPMEEPDHVDTGPVEGENLDVTGSATASGESSESGSDGADTSPEAVSQDVGSEYAYRYEYPHEPEDSNDAGGYDLAEQVFDCTDHEDAWLDDEADPNDNESAIEEAETEEAHASETAYDRDDPNDVANGEYDECDFAYDYEYDYELHYDEHEYDDYESGEYEYEYEDAYVNDDSETADRAAALDEGDFEGTDEFDVTYCDDEWECEYGDHSLEYEADYGEGKVNSGEDVEAAMEEAETEGPDELESACHYNEWDDECASCVYVDGYVLDGPETADDAEAGAAAAEPSAGDQGYSDAYPYEEFAYPEDEFEVAGVAEVAEQADSRDDPYDGQWSDDDLDYQAEYTQWDDDNSDVEATVETEPASTEPNGTEESDAVPTSGRVADAMVSAASQSLTTLGGVIRGASQRFSEVDWTNLSGAAAEDSIAGHARIGEDAIQR